jgi:hypothetical protein
MPASAVQAPDRTSRTASRRLAPMGQNPVREEKTMHLSAYHFEGDPARLVVAHDEMTAKFPIEALPLHVCVRTVDGILVLDACPTWADAVAFQQSADFKQALAEVGLPTPRIESVGEIASTVGIA